MSDTSSTNGNGDNGDASGRGRARGRIRYSPSDRPEGSGDIEVQEGMYRQPRNSSESSTSGNGNGSNGSPPSESGSVSPNGEGRRGEVLGRPAGFLAPTNLIVTRPPSFKKNGCSGQLLSLRSNYFQVTKPNNISFRLHDTKFEPELDNVRVKRALLRTREDKIGRYLFDGKMLFTSFEIPADQLVQENVGFPDKEERYRVTLTFVRVCAPMEPVTIQLYNLIVRKTQELMGLTEMNRNYFDAAGRRRFEQFNLEMWPGFATSMRQMENELLLNVDIAFKVIRTENVFDVLRKIRNESRDGNWKQRCESAVVGSIIMTKYNKKTYRVDEIAWNQKPTDTFTIKRGGVERQISYIAYFESKNVQVSAHNQPMLISKPTRRDIRRGDTGDKLFVAEHCVMTGLSEAMRQNFRMMKELSSVLHQHPRDRLLQTRSFVQRANENQEVQRYLQQWGMKYNATPVEVPGRILEPEAVLFGNGQEKKPDKERFEWAYAFRDTPMYKSQALRNWVIIYSQNTGESLRNVIDTMARVARPLGYRMDPPKSLMVEGRGPVGFLRKIDEAMSRFKGNCDLIMCILPDPNLQTYSEIKQRCSLHYGVPSQCLLSKNTTPQGLMSKLTKLVIQMNAKQGGEPWAINNPMKGTMVVGFDVHHKGRSSFGAMVASVNDSLSRYYSTVVEQVSGSEIGSELGSAFSKCLEAFIRINNGAIPKRIMFYRDGVGVGQLNYVYNSELQLIKKCMEEVCGKFQKDATLPLFSFVVVSKRTTSRIFSCPGGPDTVNNPPPGTIVDDRITYPERYDFYLISTKARNGTVSPTQYNVLFDESGLAPDRMQRYTYKMTYLYYNWSGTVAVPAVCQFAHKLAFLTGTALFKSPNERLSGMLHFL